jgi:N-acetylmuramoyl-L-alanine amidase
VYNEHDRPSTVRIVVTVAGGIAGVALLIAVAAIAFGMMVPKAQPASPLTQEKASVQAPATANAPIATAEPAPTAAVTTAAVASAAAAAPAAAPAQPAAAPAPTPVSSGLGVVVIDAGHQGKGDPTLEWDAPPGAGREKKPKVESGATGVATHVDESMRNLQVALKLQQVLVSRGVKVVMIRTSQNVNISNSERAAIANRNHAALFIRLHCDGGAASATGILTLVPGKNWYPDHPIVKESDKAAHLIHAAALAATGANDRGITPRTDLSGFNWAQVPSVLVEMGQMSNPTEDKKLGTPSYQQKLADGMANGIISYLKKR